MHRPGHHALAISVVALLAIGVPNPAQAGTASPLAQQLSFSATDPFAADMSPETLAIMRKQEALQPAVSVLQSALADSAEGFASIGFEGDGITIYWKGYIPGHVQGAVDAARRIGSVEVKRAAFSRAELEAAAARITAAAERGSDLQSIEIKSDGSGLNHSTDDT